MANEPPNQRKRLTAWFHSHRALFGALIIIAALTGVLFAASQIARNWGQDVDWYSGFGQWLGALASFVAAGAALWISTSDRRENMRDRQRLEGQQEADLARQAGLVQVTAGMLGQAQVAGPSIRTASIAIRNRRLDRIFQIEVVKFIHHGEEMEMPTAKVRSFAISPKRPNDSLYFREHLPFVVIDTDELLVIYQQGDLPNTPADYAAVRYTDSAGRRWEVDTDGVVTRR